MVDDSDQLFKEGKKLYIVGNYSKALEFLSKACKIREKNLGHLHDTMFETYYFLAKGYYMFSKYENELIGDGLEIDKDKEKENDSNIDKIHESEKDLDENCEKDSKSEVEKDELKIENEAEPSGSAGIQEDEEQPEEFEKENPTYLQLAYETIECAKLVLKNQLNENKAVENESDLEIKLADCCDLVANIYLEEGVINEAIDQYEKALELRKKHLKCCDRSIAESYYNLGVAFGVDMRPADAVKAYQECREIMVKCQSFEGASKAAELAEIIADIDEKISDSREGERDYALAKESIKQFMMTAYSDQPVNDLTHLLRRKSNAPRSSDAADEPPVSKRKLE